MSWYSLAFRNMKKSFRDYVVYFLTLVFGVAIFYIFNSVGDQSAVLSLSETSYEFVETMLLLLEMVSVGVAFVLGFLIIYANNFLIQRRKKEFGIYLLLGMNKRDVSKVLVGETFLVGLISLATGIVIGVFVAQFMSILVAKFFDADMSAYVFTVSGGAIVKTVINFMIIYLVVLLFHTIIISKLKLMDLLSAEKKTEKQVFKNPVIAMIVFVISATALGYAYYRVGYCYEDVNRDEFIRHIMVGIVTTYLVFWSLSGFLLSLLRKAKKVYFKGLNSFVIRQFCKSINSSVTSMAIICLMLFAMICTFSGGFSMAHQLQENLRKMTPVDLSIMYTKKEKITDLLEKEGMPMGEWAKTYVEVPIYHNESITWEASLGDGIEAARNQYPYAAWNTMENIMSLSDYNELAEMYHMDTYELEEDEYLSICDFTLLVELRNESLAKGTKLQIGEATLKPVLPHCADGYLMMSGMSSNVGITVVPDNILINEQAEFEISGYVLASDYQVITKERKREVSERLYEAMADYTAGDYTDAASIPPMTIGTKQEIRDSNNGLTMIVAFVVIYIGVVFLISSAAMLALKALSETIDSTGKYVILKKIGCEQGMLRKSLLMQIGVYFALPMLVAVIHSIFGLKYINYMMNMFTRQSIFRGVLITGILLVVLYGGYLLATYSGSKRIVGLEE